METRDARARRAFQHIIGLCSAFCWLAAVLPVAEGQFALSAVSTINLNGNNLTVDSFNSQDPLHSDWHSNYFGPSYGYYPLSDPIGKRLAGGVVAAGSNIINVGNAAIYGYVITAPGGAVSVMKNGSVGDTNWIGPDPGAPLNEGIQRGHAGTNLNFAFPGVSLPSATWASLPTTSTNIGGKQYTYIIKQRGTYVISSTLTANLYVAATNVVLYLPGGINLSGNSATLTVGTNFGVTVYCGGPINISGGAAFNNVNQLAAALRIFGLPPGIDSAGDNVNGCTSISVGGSGTGTTVFAPEASLTFYGGGSSAYDVLGAFVVHDITINGKFSFHYDESLTPHSAPWIIDQPTDCIVAASSNAAFTVSAIGSSLNYQWYFDQTNLITNIYQSSLVLTNIQPSDAGDYRVVITDSYGSVTSAPANLFVYTDATPFLSNPGSQNGQLTFNVSGVTGLNYSVETSTNLMDWMPLETNVSPFLFTDTNTAAFQQRFYRSVFVQ